MNAIVGGTALNVTPIATTTYTLTVTNAVTLQSNNAANTVATIQDGTGAGTVTATILAPAGQFVMVGDPSGVLPALVTGADASAWPFERMYPALFRVQPPK